MPSVMINISVAGTPAARNQTSLNESNVSTERPVPNRTMAPDRGSMPRKVPRIYEETGTRAAARKKFVKANGITTDIRMSVMIEVVFR